MGWEGRRGREGERGREGGRGSDSAVEQRVQVVSAPIFGNQRGQCEGGVADVNANS